jgi:hypothetical protein
MATTYTVTFSRAGDNRIIGVYRDYASATRAARAAGAIIPRTRPCLDVGLDVRGHQHDDAYGIWIEPADEAGR